MPKYIVTAKVVSWPVIEVSTDSLEHAAEMVAKEGMDAGTVLHQAEYEEVEVLQVSLKGWEDR